MSVRSGSGGPATSSRAIARMSALRTTGLAVGALVAVVLAVILLWPHADPSDMARARPGSTISRRPPDASVASESADASSVRVRLGPDELGILTICDDTDGSPLQGFLIPAPAVPGSTIPTESLAGVPRSDAEGRVALDLLSQSVDWLVLVPGFVPCVVSRPEAGQTVRLTRASPLRVQVLGEDSNPVEGVAIGVTPWRAAPSLRDPWGLAAGVGDPRSTVPVWVGRTDGKGHYTCDTLPQASYVLRVSHPFSYARTPAGYRQEPVHAPGSVFIEMRDLYAVCVEAPPERTVITYSWTLPQNREVSVPLQVGKDGARQYLAQEFPNALVYVGRPSPTALRSGAPAIVGCRAVLDGNVGADVEWALMRIRSIRSPVFLEPNKDVVRTVVIHVHSESGDPLPMTLVLVRQGTRGGHWVKTGRPTLLRGGRYTVSPVNAAHWVADEFEKVWVEVRESDPMRIERTIQVRGACRLVILEPKWGDGVFEGAMHVVLTSAAGNHGVMNWTPARGQIEYLSPLGAASYRTQGPPGYESASHSFVVDRGKGPLRLVIPLIRSAPGKPARRR